MSEWWLPAWLGLAVLQLLGLVWLARRQADPAAAEARREQAERTERAARELRTELQDSARASRSELQGTLSLFQQTLLTQSGDVARTQNEQIDSFRTQLATLQQQVVGALAQAGSQLAAQGQAAREAQDSALKRQADSTSEGLQRLGSTLTEQV